MTAPIEVQRPDELRRSDQPDGPPAVEIVDGALGYGARTIWSQLSLRVQPGQFVAILGTNGSGKTSLLRVLLGEQPLTAGTARILGRPVGAGSDRIGYVPQRTAVDSHTMIKARDMVRMGLDGHRWGPALQFGGRRRRTRAVVDRAIAAVGAAAFADSPVGMLSGGEFQRIRIAQALASDPELLICDEPLTALDVRHQQQIAALIDERRRSEGTAVLFVTHEINAVLPYTDLVLYLAEGRFRIGTPDEVITSASLTALYGSPVEVVRSNGRVAILAAHTDDHETWPPAPVDPKAGRS